MCQGHKDKKDGIVFIQVWLEQKMWQLGDLVAVNNKTEP